MEYRRFGKTELQLPVLTFGAMRIPDPVGEDQALATIHRAVEAGLTHLETARFYGNSEDLLGKVLQDIPRDQVILTTKIPPCPADAYRMLLEQSMKKLGVDYLDNLDVHGLNNDEMYEYTFRADGALEGARKAMDDGLVGHLGFSTHAPLEFILKCLDTDEFESMNVHYYYMRQRNLAAVQRAHEKDMGVLIISPSDKGGKLYAPTDVLTELCAPYSPVGLNHRFCLTTPGVTTCTVGAAHPDELDLHLAIADGGPERTAEEQRLIDGLTAGKVQGVGATYCTECYDCLPCPEKIDIPEILRYRNLAVAFDMTDYGNYRYDMLGNADHWQPGVNATACTKCGDCLPRCPEKLDIPTLLFDTHDRLAGEGGQRLWAEAEV